MACAVPSSASKGDTSVHTTLKVTGEVVAFIAQAMAILFSVGFMALIAWIVT